MWVCSQVWLCLFSLLGQIFTLRLFAPNSQNTLQYISQNTLQYISHKLASNSRHIGCLSRCLFTVQLLTEVIIIQRLWLFLLYSRVFSFPISALYIHDVKYISHPFSSQIRENSSTNPLLQWLRSESGNKSTFQAQKLKKKSTLCSPRLRVFFLSEAWGSMARSSRASQLAAAVCRLARLVIFPKRQRLALCSGLLA